MKAEGKTQSLRNSDTRFGAYVSTINIDLYKYISYSRIKRHFVATFYIIFSIVFVRAF